jgi:hypothetical protein
MSSKWNLAGNYFEACNCDVGCPCVFTSAPTQGNCTVLLAWHIEKGKYGDTNLDGLNVALAVYSPGHMLKVKWDIALYLDEKANPAQKEALTTIYAGKAGGEPAALGPLIGKVLGVKSVPIQFTVSGKERSLRIAKIAEMEIAALPGAGGKDITLENLPFTAVPNQTTVVAKSKKLSFHDFGMDWNVSEKNGFYMPFSFKGP